MTATEYLSGTEDGKAKPSKPFVIERFYAKYEFTAPYQLSCSDSEPTSLSFLLKLLEKEPKEIQDLWNNLILHYTETKGHIKLREEISKFYNEKVDTSQIIALCPEEGIFCFMNQFLKEGDEVVAVWPAYQSLVEIARQKGCKIKLWGYEVTEEGPIFNVSTLKALITKDTKMLIINFPHNPTGFIPSLDDLKQIIALCRENDVFIFSDEMYRGLMTDEKATLLPSVCELYDKSCVLSGVSKTLSGPGLRIGWLVLQDEDLLSKISELRDYTTICSSAPGEILALIALRNRDVLVGDNNNTIRTNLKVLKAFAEKYPTFMKFYQPKGSSIFFPEIIHEKITDVTEFCDNLIKECGIVLLPESIFTNDGKKGQRRVRFGTGRKNLPEVMDKLEEYLKAKAYI